METQPLHIYIIICNIHTRFWQIQTIGASSKIPQIPHRTDVKPPLNYRNTHTHTQTQNISPIKQVSSLGPTAAESQWFAKNVKKYSSDKAWFKQIREILKDWYLDLIECTWIRNRLDTHYRHCASEPPSNNDALAYLYVWKAIDTVLVLEESGGIYLMRGTLLNLAFTGKCAKEWMKETEDEGRQPRTVKQT